MKQLLFLTHLLCLLCKAKKVKRFTKSPHLTVAVSYEFLTPNSWENIYKTARFIILTYLCQNCNSNQATSAQHSHQAFWAIWRHVGNVTQCDIKVYELPRNTH